jgi:ketosteroid isomerase-like protein
VSNAETVQAISKAFGRGDIATILDKLDDAVEWETTVPARWAVASSTPRRTS